MSGWSPLTWFVAVVTVVVAVVALTGSVAGFAALPPCIGWLMARTQHDDAKRRIRTLTARRAVEGEGTDQ